MILYSTNNPQHTVNFKEAIFRGLPPDNGLYMPSVIPVLPADFWNTIGDRSFQENSYLIASAIQSGAIPENDLKSIINEAMDFPAPVVRLDDNRSILELFHGPSLAFKDFGARYMARIMSYFNRGEDKTLNILVATSGDTGGAVAFGFHKVPGIRVVILYPFGKVSHLQEQQLTTLGHNVTAIEVNGTFDDCQAMVKKAFLDQDLTSAFRLSSANSINIARLIPQMFYYAEAYRQVRNWTNRDIVFAVPSGNYGNLTAGLMLKKMGLPAAGFIAASNQNSVVPEYLEDGNYQPRPSVKTLSNAMDVGNPSNFARMQDLYGSTWNNLKQDIWGASVDDSTTIQKIQDEYARSGYVLDPHTAVGLVALEQYQQMPEHRNTVGVVLGTAHPSKFLNDVEQAIQAKVEVPERLQRLSELKKESVLMTPDFEVFKPWLLDNLS